MPSVVLYSLKAEKESIVRNAVAHTISYDSGFSEDQGYLIDHVSQVKGHRLKAILFECAGLELGS